MPEVQILTGTSQLNEGTAIQHCPDCGCLMTEVERVTESGYTFVWYECRQDNCNGQWLEKLAC